jgi:hypothetical protein
MFNDIEIGSYLTKLIWFGWFIYDHIRLDAILRWNIYNIFRQKVIT